MSNCFEMGGISYSREKVLVIAELSANHNGSYERTVELVAAAVDAGADAIKVQTYTADSMTLDSDKPEFVIEGTIWEGRKLHDLYGEAAMPWDWQPGLARECEKRGVHFFSSPFDFAAVDFLEGINVPAYKIASFELVDIPLIEKAASTGKPLIMSTGMATREEIEEAVTSARKAGAGDLSLLKCTSAYPSPPDEMNLATIADLSESFGVLAGLSDHTLGIAAPVCAVALGAGVVEKHFTLSRDDGGADSAFSLEPKEFRDMVESIRVAEASVGQIRYGGVDSESATRKYRRSLYVTENIKAGETFTEENVKSLRPAYGLPPREYSKIVGLTALADVDAGTPITWEMVNLDSHS